ncbi:MAG: hypothetical protein GVY12_11080 [Bacteroidetes bacterium]|jgi:predicted nuclease of predicted toxin-antitoxin system|nr:hypothetical protein [Bacteroidota bacterium]
MRFKTDENLPSGVTALLQEAGFDAASVMSQHLGGVNDARIARVCQKEERVLVTLDTDFADIRTYPPSDYSGIIVLRLRRQDAGHVCAVFSRVLPHLLKERPNRHLWIVSEEHIRIRG